MMDATVELRFRKYFDVGEATEYWPWKGGLVGGYGRFNWEKCSNYAHRAAYTLFIGPIERKDVIRHTCDNRRCVNPAHLLRGTQSDNMRDMMVRGRAPFQKNPELYKDLGRRTGLTQRGENHARAKLSNEDVRIIRYLASRGAFHVDIAKTFFVSKDCIAGIVSGRERNNDAN